MAWSPQWSRWSRRSQVWRFYRVVRLLFKTILVLARERNRVMHALARGQYSVHADGAALRAVMIEFRQTAVALGGLMIKLGQFLSARADLLPQEALAELAQLQDEVPPEPFGEIAAAIERELHTPIASLFATIEPRPAGSASLGQVHRARLHSGAQVAVKVQRPDIERLVQADLAALGFVLAVVRTVYPAAERMLDTRRLFREFSRVVYEELDYRREGHSAEHFAHLFAQVQDVTSPSVVWEHSTRRVLTLSWVDGIKVADITALDAAGIDRRALAQRLTDVYLVQILQYGFFHADPHPGNIFVRPLGAGFQLAFVDFGMMGSVTPAHKRALSTAFIGVVHQDARLLVDALESLGFIGVGANRESLEHVLAQLLGRYSTLSMGEMREMDPAELLDDVGSLLYGHQFRLPYQFAFLGRAMGTLSGLVTMISPEFNFMEAALPYAREYIRHGGLATLLEILGVETVGELGRLLTRESMAIARSVAALPRLAERVLERVEHGDLRLVIDSPELLPPAHARYGGRLATRALNRPVPVWVPLGIAGVAAVGLALWRRIANGD